MLLACEAPRWVTLCSRGRPAPDAPSLTCRRRSPELCVWGGGSGHTSQSRRLTGEPPGPKGPPPPVGARVTAKHSHPTQTLSCHEAGSDQQASRRPPTVSGREMPLKNTDDIKTAASCRCPHARRAERGGEAARCWRPQRGGPTWRFAPNRAGRGHAAQRPCAWPSMPERGRPGCPRGLHTRVHCRRVQITRTPRASSTTQRQRGAKRRALHGTAGSPGHAPREEAGPDRRTARPHLHVMLIVGAASGLGAARRGLRP